VAHKWNFDIRDEKEQDNQETSPPGNDELIFEVEKSEKKSVSVPATLPILPLRGLVVYPETAVPLTVGQPRSIQLIDDAVAGEGERLIGLAASKKPELENPGPEDIFTIGVVAQVHRLFRAPDGTIRLLVQGIARLTIKDYIQTEPYLVAKVEQNPEDVETGLEIDALTRNVKDQFIHIAQMVPSMPQELIVSISAIDNPLQAVYTIANFQRMELAEAQEVLEINSVKEKLQKLVAILTRESEVLELGQKIQSEARSEIDKVQREYFLREQLKAIQKELGEGDEGTADAAEFRDKIEQAGMPEEAEKQSLRELDRLSKLPTAAAEYGVIRTYLDWLVSLPWSKETKENLDITHARQVLDEDHYDLEDVKERIIEFLAVRKLRQEREGTISEEHDLDYIRRTREGAILCFVGPPGVGKTSLGQSIAKALNRKFIRISLGGMRDEAEIRGHRRTYIGALPGRILQAMRRVESRNPVFMLDEVDKLGTDFRGDPASALLEVLDPEQNENFRDNYIEVAFDLSEVLFITTANTLETIPPPLLDRMDVLQLSGYTEKEKTIIAQKYLIPRQLLENGLEPDELSFTEDAIHDIIQMYTREAGVRSLERRIGAVCRKVVTLISENKTFSKEIDTEHVREYLGRPRFLKSEEVSRRISIPGVAIGLAWTPVGGEVLFIEATKMPGGKGFQITGSIGDVMQESARAALSFIRSRAAHLGLDENFFDKIDIHLHIPSGAQPKDGPSAGVTIATALASLLLNRTIKPDLAMTGEITLRGQVLPVGGIKEKVLAAHRYELSTVILPSQNQYDLEDIPEEIRNTMKFIFVDTVDEVFQHAFDLQPAAEVATT
jgi:ATP-dependent Lon protease